MQSDAGADFEYALVCEIKTQACEMQLARPVDGERIGSEKNAEWIF